MLKTADNKLRPAVISTLIYLQSLLAEEEMINVSVSGEKITIATNDEELVDPIILGEAWKGINPIQHMLYHVNDEMCSDCLMEDWQFKNPYFVDLVESYIDSLVHTYGLNVPIPYELARAILKWDLSDYDVLAKKEGKWDHTTLTAELLEMQYKRDYTFYLKVDKYARHQTTN